MGMTDCAPRKKKRLSCEIVVNESRYSGIAIDVSATGIFIQTNLKPAPGSVVKVGIQLPGIDEPVMLEARVARKKNVPPELLTLAHGGIGLALVRPGDRYLDFIAELSPEHAEAVAGVRSKTSSVRRGGGSGGAARTRSGSTTAIKRFRIHAVETASGKRNSFLATCETEQEASDELLKQLGDEWQVLFIERA
jgi:hypothetical protein